MTPVVKALVTAASASYTANCALGIAVATGRLDTSRARWVHHAVYVATVTLSLGAAAALLRTRDRALLRLLPAAVPLAAIPHVSARTRGHVLLALTAAPAYVATLAAVRS
ncbi:hypothetical protein [Kineococcus rubinsiae]|uniref:hypothetical protein n=1 Tax=Kineococcus rubinsiae TaxID=2609562 RepID=UPI00142F7AA8|nr:hypothetical protein [Kineococcus rubinsiae]NIZ90975.1 hypothetical protein [Kineococcus rubinsiae]